MIAYLGSSACPVPRGIGTVGGSPPPPPAPAYEPPLVSVTDDGVVSNGPRLYAGFVVPTAVAGTVNVYNGPNSSLGDLIHSVTNPSSGVFYTAAGVTNVDSVGRPTSDDRSTWISCISIWVTQPAQTTNFLTDD